jgi:transcriptional regulator with XRE-family HTH domain
MDIAKLIEIIQESGLTQVEIAERTGVSQGQISDILRGRRKDMVYASGKRIEALAKEVNPKMFSKAA